jgi:hypothetical protein
MKLKMAATAGLSLTLDVFNYPSGFREEAF